MGALTVHTCECGHSDLRHWFYAEDCLDCDCGRYFQAKDKN